MDQPGNPIPDASHVVEPAASDGASTTPGSELTADAFDEVTVLIEGLDDLDPAAAAEPGLRIAELLGTALEGDDH